MRKRLAGIALAAAALVGTTAVPANAAGSITFSIKLEGNPGRAGAYITDTKPVSYYKYAGPGETWYNVRGFKSLSYCTLVSQWGYRYPRGVWNYVSSTASGSVVFTNDCDY